MLILDVAVAVGSRGWLEEWKVECPGPPALLKCCDAATFPSRHFSFFRMDLVGSNAAMGYVQPRESSMDEPGSMHSRTVVGEKEGQESRDV